MIIDGKHTMCEKLLEREEREIEGKERGMREERAPFLFFSLT